MEIINALLNASTNEEFKIYLEKSLSKMNIDTTKPLSVSIDSDKFLFLKQLYPNITFVNSPNTLFFTEHSTLQDTMTITCSFFEKENNDKLKIGISENDDGVVITSVDKSTFQKDPYQLYPYALCLTDKPKSLETFLKIIGSEKVNKFVDVFVPNTVLNKKIDYSLVRKQFKTIEIHRGVGDIVSVYNCIDELDDLECKTLRIHVFDEMVTPSMIEYGMKHVLIDYEIPNYQLLIDTLSNFPEKIVWCSGKQVFFKDLKKYTFCGKLQKSVNLKCYQLKKNFESKKLLKKLNLIMKLGFVAPSIKKAIDIIDDKTSHTRKLYNLLDLS